MLKPVSVNPNSYTAKLPQGLVTFIRARIVTHVVALVCTPLHQIILVAASAPEAAAAEWQTFFYKDACHN